MGKTGQQRKVRRQRTKPVGSPPVSGHIATRRLQAVVTAVKVVGLAIVSKIVAETVWRLLGKS